MIMEREAVSFLTSYMKSLDGCRTVTTVCLNCHCDAHVENNSCFCSDILQIYDELI